MIKKEGDYWVVKSEDGTRSFGKYKSKRAAHIRLGQIEWFGKHKRK